MEKNDKVLKKRSDGQEKRDRISDKSTRSWGMMVHKLTFSEYLAKISKSIDKKIVSQERNKKMVFVGGSAKFSVDKPEEKVRFVIEYYYKSEDGQWFKQTEEGSTEISQFNESDEDTLKFLNSSEGVEKSIESPRK